MGNIFSKISFSGFFNRGTKVSGQPTTKSRRQPAASDVEAALSPDNPYEELPSEVYESPRTLRNTTDEDLISFDTPDNSYHELPSEPPSPVHETRRPTIRLVPKSTSERELLPFEDGMPLGRVVNGVRITQARPVDLLEHWYGRWEGPLEEPADESSRLADQSDVAILIAAGLI